MVNLVAWQFGLLPIEDMVEIGAPEKAIPQILKTYKKQQAKITMRSLNENVRKDPDDSASTSGRSICQQYGGILGADMRELLRVHWSRAAEARTKKFALPENDDGQLDEKTLSSNGGLAEIAVTVLVKALYGAGCTRLDTSHTICTLAKEIAK